MSHVKERERRNEREAERGEIIGIRDENREDEGPIFNKKWKTYRSLRKRDLKSL